MNGTFRTITGLVLANFVIGFGLLYGYVNVAAITCLPVPKPLMWMAGG